MKGKFIVLEGSDGSGKSTLAGKLKDYYDHRGAKVLLTREPGGTDLGEEIRDMILRKQGEEMDPRTEALLYAASRAEHVFKKIKPAVEEGYIVLCERYILSSLAYQGYGRELGPQEVLKINEFATGSFRPDVTFYLKVDWQKTLQRKIDQGGDRLELAGDAFFKRVQEGYQALAQSKGIHVLDAGKNPEEIYQECIKILEEVNG